MRKPRNRRRPVAFAALALGVVVVSAGCSEQHVLSDAALGQYLERHGVRTDPASPPPVAPPPVARRLALTVVSARGLPDLDPGPGDSDPYVEVRIDGQRHRTTVIEGSLDPVWGDSFVLDIGSAPVLELLVRDEDGLSSDETIAVVSRVLEPLAVGHTLELEIPLRDGAAGYVTIRLTGLASRDGTPRRWDCNGFLRWRRWCVSGVNPRVASKPAVARPWRVCACAVATTSNSLDALHFPPCHWSASRRCSRAWSLHFKHRPNSRVLA